MCFSSQKKLLFKNQNIEKKKTLLVSGHSDLVNRRANKLLWVLGSVQSHWVKLDAWFEGWLLQ
jgi:hypothetical protein